MSCNFGLKSYLWFQIEPGLGACLIFKLHVWFQTKLPSTQFNHHYLWAMKGSNEFVQLRWHWATWATFEQCLWRKFNECIQIFPCKEFLETTTYWTDRWSLISLLLHGCCFQSLDTSSWYSDTFNYNVKISSAIPGVGS